MATEEWLIILENNGWYYSNFPNDVVSKIGELMKAGLVLKDVVFAPNRGWLIILENNGWYYSNFPNDVVSKIGELMKAGLVLKNVVFAPNGGWLIILENNGWYYSGGFPNDAVSKIGELMKAGLVLKNVVFAPNGGWLIILENNGWYYSGGFPNDAVSKIGELMGAGLVLKNVVFAPNGSWLIILENNGWYYSGGFPNGASGKIGELMGAGFVLHNLVFPPPERRLVGDPELQNGDILVFVPTDVTGFIIDTATGGYGYSHVGLVCGNEMVDVNNTNDPTHPQVERVPLTQSLMRRHVGVRLGISPFQSFRLCQAALGRLGQGLDWTALLTGGWLSQPNTDLCTTLIMKSLDDIGVDRAALGLGGFVSPNDIARLFHAPQGGP